MIKLRMASPQLFYVSEESAGKMDLYGVQINQYRLDEKA